MNLYANSMLLFILSFISLLAQAMDPVNRAFLNAAQYDNIQKVQALIEQRADVNTQDEYNETALIRATKRHYKDMVELLLKHKANVHLSGSHHITPLMHASFNRDKDIVELLLKAGAGDSINIQDTSGVTALMYAVRENYKDIVELLLKNKADVNIQDKHGGSALMYSRSPDIVKLLFSANVDINLKTKDGKTALDIMQSMIKIGLRQQYKEIKKMLIIASTKKKLSIFRKATVEAMVQQPNMPYLPKEMIEHIKSYL